MAVALSIFGVTFAAVCVWLTIRIFNRRERWAKCTLATTIVLPVLYVMSTGPAVWLCGGDQQLPEWVQTIYWPIRVMPEGPEFVEDAFDWYVGLWLD